jgi:hypothetical protein
MVSLVAGCASGPPAPTPVERDLARYKALPNYRALAVTGRSMATEHYIYAWSKGTSSIDGAAKEAVRDCASHQAATDLPACGLYAIGDIVVATATPDQIERAKCIYILNPTAKSLDDPYAGLCASAQTMKMTLPGEAGLPSGGSALMTQLAAPGTAPAGHLVLANLSDTAGGSDASAALLTADAIRDELAGNTLAVNGSSYVYLKDDGTTVRRTAATAKGPSTGSWRVNGDGYYCARWPDVEHGHEICRPLVQKGDTYELGDVPVTLISGNAFGL